MTRLFLIYVVIDYWISLTTDLTVASVRFVLTGPFPIERKAPLIIIVVGFVELPLYIGSL